MAAAVEVYQRPLKKSRLGIPDIYPQEAKQGEVSCISIFLGNLALLHVLYTITCVTNASMVDINNRIINDKYNYVYVP